MDILKNLDRSELESAISVKHGQTVETVHAVIQTFIEGIRQGVALKGYVEIDGLGSFRLQTLLAQEGVAFGKEYAVPERVTVQFNPFLPFRNDVETIVGKPCIL